jgi:hypothetical protein
MITATHRWGIRYSTDITHDLEYLQEQVDNTEDFARPGELFLNEPLQKLYYLDAAGVVQGVTSHEVRSSIISDTPAPDTLAYSVFTINLIDDLTLLNPSHDIDGKTIRFIVRQNSVGGHILSLSDKYVLTTSGLPLGPNAVSIMQCTCDGDEWVCAVL